VLAMEGNGPGTGDPKKVGLLLAAESPLALDVVASEVIGVPRHLNPVLMEAERRGMMPFRIEDVELIGLGREELRVHDFKLPATIYGGTGFAREDLNPLQRMMVPLFRSGLTVRPKVIARSCVGCRSCHEACPMGAIQMVAVNKGEKAFIDDDRCIRCYCCHEMCPENAIALQRSLLHRLVNP
jgi:ferredoxin